MHVCHYIYFKLIRENYQWWWRSFFISGSAGVYVFLFSIFYFFTQTDIKRFSTSVVYFSTMLLASITLGIMTGTIGFLASFSFNRKIFAMIKGD
jgi:transmembrane 9 superfamily protein 2/4